MLVPPPLGSGWRWRSGALQHERQRRRAARPGRRAALGTISTSAAAVWMAWRRTASRIGSSSTSPAVPMLPPTTIRSGLKRLQRFGDGACRCGARRRRWRAGSPRSPSAARREHVVEREVLAEAAAEQLDDRRPGGVGLQAAAVAAAADRRPSSSRIVWPISPAVPPAAAEQAAADDQPRADAGRDLEVDEVRATPPGAPVSSASAPRLASFSTWTGRARRALISSLASDARPSRGGSPRADRAGHRVDRPGQTEADAEHAVARDRGPGAAACATSSAAASRPWAAG